MTAECGTLSPRQFRVVKWHRRVGAPPSIGRVNGSVSVVIPARNNAADLPEAVALVLAQPRIVEVLLCVGPSHDDTHSVANAIAATDSRVMVVANDDGGIPQALNLGLARVTGDVLMRVDAHSFVPAGYVDNAFDTMQATGAANVGAVQVPVGQTIVERGIAAAMASRLGSGGAAYRVGTERRQVDTAFLGFFRTEALRSIGGWDERFARNEDAELNARLAAAGHEVWLDPRLRVAYRPRPSLTALARQYWHYGLWRVRTALKHPSSLRTRQLAAPVVVLGLTLSAIVAATVSPWALVVPVAYATLVAAAAMATGGPFAERAVAAAALITLHLSWGSAFLVSGVASLIRRLFGRGDEG